MPLTKFRKDKNVNPWTIYLWEEGDLIRGAAKVVKDGMDEIFVSGRWVERDEQWSVPNHKKDIFIAKSQTKTDLQNTLNALNWYGIEIMDKGGINEEKFIKKEMKAGVSASGIHIDISHLYPVKKYPVKNITFEEAQRLGLT